MVTRAPKVFKDQKSLDRAAEALAKTCRIMHFIHRRHGPPPLRDYSPGFAGIAKIVTGQQLSAQSAAAIWSRVEPGIRPFTAEALLRLNEIDLARFGLSGGKIRTLRAVAAEVAGGDLDFAALDQAPNEDILERLTAIHGIGPWTADIYLLFALKRADAFPAGDLALQIAAQKYFRLDDRPKADALLRLSERWRPFRGAAARMLWSDYTAARVALRERQHRNTR